MSLRSKIGASLVALLPMVTLAAFFQGTYFTSIAETFGSIISALLPAFIGLLLIGFFYGLFIYVKSAGEEKERGKSIMLWGAIAVVIALSIYGIAGLLQNLTGADTGLNPNATPTVTPIGL